MRKSKRFLFLGGMAAIAIVAAPVVAIASHGKAGLWSITMAMDLPGMHAQEMPQFTPEQMQQMKAMGVQVPQMSPGGMKTTIQHCMTAQEVNSNTPPPTQNRDCTVQNIKVTGNVMTADTVCTGEMSGSGHMSVTYDSTEHYSGKMAFTGVAHGQHVSMNNAFEGRWVSASCGAVTH